MVIININDLPYVEFGDSLKRQVRLVASPYTTGDEGIAIVNVVLPPGAISEGHIHDECDEIIYFTNDGKAVLDGKEYEVKKNSVFIAGKGKKHECINTSDSEELILLCIFVPAFQPYGKYPELIEKTVRYLGGK